MGPIQSNERWLLAIVRQEFVNIAKDERRSPSYRKSCRDLVIPALDELIKKAQPRDSNKTENG